MKPLIAALAIVFTLATGTTAVAITESSNLIETAARYLAAYSEFDTNKMEPLLSDDMVFIDPTKPPEQNNGQVFTHIGKKAVLAALSGYAKLYEEFSLDYKIDRRYESNGVVVFVGNVTYDILTGEGRTLTGTAPIVTAVEIRDGKVVRHTDYYDYAGNAVDMKN